MSVGKEMRAWGKVVLNRQETLGITNKTMALALGCTEEQYQKFLYGRLFLSFEQMELLSVLIDYPLEQVMNAESTETDGEAFILDLIDRWLTLYDATKEEKR